MVLIFFILAIIKGKKENLNNIKQYKYYRFGDVVKGYIYKRKSKGVFNKYIKKYSNTLAAKYINAVDKLPDDKKWNNMNVLDNISKGGKKIDVAIHLRVGDVIGKYNKKNNTFKKKHKYTYFYQPYYFSNLAKKLKKRKINEVYIFYGSHKNFGNNSKKYVELVEQNLKNEGIKIKHINKGNPDDDFVNMSNAKIFVNSGGGYSKLIGDLVRFRGNEVINPGDFN